MSKVNDRIDELELAMQDAPPVDCPVTHNFIPGYYIRTIFMPAGALITSQIHRTQHNYHISSGSVNVRIGEGEWESLEAPYCGITQPGTRRVLFVTEPCTWSTFHPILDSEQPEYMLEEEVSEAVDRIGARIIEPHENKLLGGTIKNNIIYKSLEDDKVL